MALLDMKDKRNKAFVDVLLQKAKKPAEKAKTSVRGGGSLIDRIKNIESMVQSKLGHYKEELMLVQTEADLHAYIDKAIENGDIAIDTETTGLDPFTCHIVGVCLYTPGMKSCYIPMYHTSYISRQRVPNQLDNEVVAKELQRLIDNNIRTIFFNAKFDIRMMRASLGIYMTPYWDGFIAAKCLKENEVEASLKYLWKKYCSPDKDAAHFTFDKFFKGIQFDLIPVHTAYLYAAMDTKMTYELYKFQEPYLTETDEKCKALDMTRLAKLFREIEMPIITITADIEDRGVIIDKEFANELSIKYHTMMDEQLNKFYDELSKYNDQINAYLATHPQTKLENPINIGSPTQLAELFYDVLKVTPPDKRNPRGTGEDILKAMKHPLCSLILDYRGTQKLLSTYIDKLPESVNKSTGKLHAAFKQYGTDCITGEAIIENKEFPQSTIAAICENNIPNMEENIFYPLEITIKNRYMEWEKTSHCIKFNNVDVIKLSFDNGDSICGTYNHPILLENNIFKELEYIQIGEKVKTIDSVTTVIEKEFLSNKTVYDFKVPGTHSFVSNTIISHNTGRYASADPNLQNIPSHQKEIRLLFISCRFTDLNIQNSKLNLLWGDVIMTPMGKKFIQELTIGEQIVNNKSIYTIKDIQFDGDTKYQIVFNEEVNIKIRVNRLYIMVGADYSQQEPKLTAELSNDEKFIAECAAGKDAYGTVASLAFNKPYEECLEFYLDENGNKTDHINKEGKERRTQSKSILLGITYGRTIKTIAEQLGCTEEKAKQIYDSVFNGIAGLKMLTEESEEMARQLGYVETKWGRRRHIPDMQLEPYEVIFNGTKNFDPFFDSEELGVVDDGERLRQSYIKQLKEARYRQQKDKIKMQAEKDGFKVHEHTRKIEDAKRQCVNCVDTETQILTKDGWKTYLELNKDDEIFSYNINTHQIEPDIIVAKNVHYGNFDMLHIKKKGIDCLCTLNHRFVVRDAKGDYFIEAQDINEIITFTQNKHGRFVGTVINKEDVKKVGKRNIVWCPTTINGTWIAKRGETVYISGNSRIQGSAADQTKIAMRLIGENKQLQELDFHMILLVHDEIIGECPIVNIAKVEPIFIQCMLDAAKDLRTGAKCDATCVLAWYDDQFDREIHPEELTKDKLDEIIKNSKYMWD